MALGPHRVRSEEGVAMNNVIEEKSFEFAIRIVNLCKYLKSEKKETVLSKQLLRSGTSIGANVFEAEKAQTKPDFYTKMTIALKEANETSYWLRLLHKTNYLADSEFESIYKDIDEICSILVSITKTTKENIGK